MILDSCSEGWGVDVAEEPVEGALDALMAVTVHHVQQLQQEGRTCREVQTPLEGDHPVSDGPRCRALTRCDLISESDQRWIFQICLTKSFQKSKRGPVMAMATASSVSCRERASATVLELPARYSTVKSNPSSLPTQ